MLVRILPILIALGYFNCGMSALEANEQKLTTMVSSVFIDEQIKIGDSQERILLEIRDVFSLSTIPKENPTKALVIGKSPGVNPGACVLAFILCTSVPEQIRAIVMISPVGDGVILMNGKNTLDIKLLELIRSELPAKPRDFAIVIK